MSDSVKIPEGFSYASEKLEEISCNLCGASGGTVLSAKASNGYPATTRLCSECGLVYISPRMTSAGYDRYYHYFYRQDRERAKGFAEDDERYLEKNFSAARRLGVALARRTHEYLLPKGKTLDVGSSTGGVLAGIRDVFPGVEVHGVEPSVAESSFANSKQIPTTTALFENYQYTHHSSLTWGNIVCVRSLNHLLDPKGFFTWCAENLVPGGMLLLEVKNFRFQARRAGSVSAGVQIDHPFMFTPETLVAMVTSAGFKVVYLDDDEEKSVAVRMAQRSEGLSHHHIRLAAKNVNDPSEPRDRKRAIGIRRALTNPHLKTHYLLRYSSRFAPLRRLLGR